MGFRNSDLIVFIVAVLFLIAILLAGFKVETIQSNILYLVVLSLACAMVFAFLPFDASVNHQGFIRAGGTAAIFAFCLYVVTGFTEKNYLANKASADSQITALQKILASKESELTGLRQISQTAESNGNACSNSNSLIQSSLNQILPTLNALASDIAEGVQYSSAARDNSSDSLACSARGSQSLAALSRAQPRIEAILSNLATMQDAIK